MYSADQIKTNSIKCCEKVFRKHTILPHHATAAGASFSIKIVAVDHLLHKLWCVNLTRSSWYLLENGAEEFTRVKHSYGREANAMPCKNKDAHARVHHHYYLSRHVLLPPVASGCHSLRRRNNRKLYTWIVFRSHWIDTSLFLRFNLLLLLLFSSLVRFFQILRIVSACSAGIEIAVTVSARIGKHNTALLHRCE